MNPEAYQAWLGQRDKHREALFGDEQKLDGSIRNDAGDVVGESLAAQALSKKLNGVTSAETVLMDEAKQAVDAILAYHHEHAGEENTAIFGLADPPSDFDTVQEITAGVVAQWEKVCWRNKQPSPFEDLPISDIQAADFKQPSVQLVVETASAVAETMAVGYHTMRSDVRKQQLAGLIAQRGPAYVRAFIRGELTAPEDKQEVKSLPYNLITRIALDHVDPVAALTLRIENYRQMTDEVIQQATGWSEEETQRFFTPAMRKLISCGRKNPLDTITNVARLLDTTLSIEELAAKCNMTEDDAAVLFPPQYRVDLADGHREPLNRVNKVAQAFRDTLSVESLMHNLGWTEAQVNNLFTDDVRRRIARTYTHKAMSRVHDIVAIRQEMIESFPNFPVEVINWVSSYSTSTKERALDTLRIVAKEADNKPRGVSLTHWLFVVAIQPRAGKEYWHATIARSLEHLQFRNQGSLDAPLQGDSAPSYYTIASEAKDPADLIDETEPEPDGVLSVLAATAGVPPGQVTRLLEAFSSGTDDTLSPADQAALDKLRKAAGLEE